MVAVAAAMAAYNLRSASSMSRSLIEMVLLPCEIIEVMMSLMVVIGFQFFVNLPPFLLAPG